MVGEQTGDAIQRWLDKSLRKPGKILVGRAPWDWMQQDARDSILRLDAELKHLQFPKGALFNSTYRDADAKVGKKGGSVGMVRRSIHKSGFAFDFRMSYNRSDKTKSFLTDLAYPLYWVKNDPPATDSGKTPKVKWTVYAHVDRRLKEDEYQTEGTDETPGEDDPAHYVDNSLSAPTGVDEKTFIEYVDSIQPWIYDPYSLEGGTVGAEKPAGDGRAFLNLTKVCEHFNLVPISAHDSGWQIGQPKSYTLTSAKDFKSFMAEFGKIVSLSDKSPDAEVVINTSQTFTISQLSDLYAYLSAWFRATVDLGPTPEVTFTYPPANKSIDSKQNAALRTLRADDFTGRQAEVILQGPVPQGKERVSKAALGPKAEFPQNAAFVLRPVLTDPADLSPLAKVVLPALDAPGDPSAMEWWHFQYHPGYTEKGENRPFGKILEDVGWTNEGLLMVGFTQDELTTKVDYPLPKKQVPKKPVAKPAAKPTAKPAAKKK